MKLVSVALLGVMLVSFTHCMSNAPMQGVDNASSRRGPSNLPDDNDSGGSEEQVINLAQVEVGVRTHEEILHTFAALTGVPSTHANVVSVYRDVETALPTTSDVKSYLAANQVAVTKLAGEFCRILIDQPSGFVADRAVIWPTFNFGQNLVTFTNSSANRLIFIQNMLDAFWGEGVVSPDELSVAEDELNALIDTLAEGEANNATSTRKVTKGICTIALSSAYVIML